MYRPVSRVRGQTLARPALPPSGREAPPLPSARAGRGSKRGMYRPASGLVVQGTRFVHPCAGTRRAPVRSEECHGVSPVHRADGCRSFWLPVCGGTATDSTANRVVHGDVDGTRAVLEAHGQIRLGDPRPGDASPQLGAGHQVGASPPTSKPRDRGHVDTARTHLDLPRILPHSEPLGRVTSMLRRPGFGSFGLARRFPRGRDAAFRARGRSPVDRSVL